MSNRARTVMIGASRETGRRRPHRHGLAQLGALAIVATSVLGSGAAMVTADANTWGTANIVVERMGTGTGSLGATATPIFLDEYTPAGTLVRSVALPTAASGANRAVTEKGNDTATGQLSRSADGRYLAVAGYDAAPGATVNNSAAATYARVVALVDCSATINSSTSLGSALDANVIRGAYTDGAKVWAFGDRNNTANSGIFMANVGGSTSTNLEPSGAQGSTRHLEVFGGQMYASSSGDGLPAAVANSVFAFGTGVPTTTQTTADFTPVASLSSPQAFVMFDLSPSEAGIDTLYVLDTTVKKYSKVSGTWTARGSVTVGSSLRGLTGVANGTTVSLFATSGTNLYTLADASGYNATITGTSTSIATAGTNRAFRGVALTPNVCSAPPAEVPEVPAVPLLGLAAAGVIGGGLVISRRRALR